ncbi:MAG: DNA internalization-related competence protein ComEC/Rec2 [Clostridiales bacterium]|nr:DNA internalization-related competence protein ComEC/Rec2 [Clostridiales bacterium]
MRRPFIWFLISLAVGIAAAEYTDGIYTAAVVVAITAAAVFFAAKNRIFEPLFMPLIAVIGIMLCNAALTPADMTAEQMVGGDITIRGTVREWHTNDNGKTAITLDTEYISDGEVYSGEGLRVYLTVDNAEVSAGDIIEAEGRLYAFDAPTNPYQTDYRKYMLSRGFDYSAWSSDADVVGQNGGFIYKVEALREHINSFYDENMLEREAAVAKALTTGYRYDIDDEINDMFRYMGVSHVLAISGLHISAVSGMLFYVLTRILKLKKQRAVPIVSVFLVFYLAFTGFSPSAVRAVIMAVTAFTALMLRKNSDSFNTIAFSAFIMLCINPIYLWNVSFRLSYIGITAVVFALEITKDIKAKLTKTVIFSTIVWAAVTPMTMYYFGGVSLIEVVSNIIAVPYLSFAAGAAIPAGLLSFTGLGTIAAKIMYLILHLYNIAADMVSSSVFYVETAKPSVYAVTAIYIFMLCAVILRRNRTALRITSAGFAVFAVVLAGINITAAPEIVFFDAGQGDASLIYVPGEITAVIDGGPSGGAESAVIPYLKAKGTKADLLFITHTDSDHADGAIELIDAGYVRQIVLSDAEHSDKLDEILSAADEQNISIFYASEGDIFETENCRIECLYPDGVEADGENSTSLVLMAEVEGNKILFTGDIEAEDEEKLSEKNIKCDIIKIAHHGSKTSSTEEFLAVTGADTAVIEAAENNIYGFPHDEVLERLNYFGMNVYVTGEDGAVVVACTDEGYSLKTFG